MTAPHDAPSSLQMVEAVREWLENDVMPAVEGRLNFHTRVAINMLAMVEREAVLGDQQRVDHESRLQNIGAVDDLELATRIRGGEFDDSLKDIMLVLKDSVRDKLLVANPKYLNS
jgi:hypothetical protein